MYMDETVFSGTDTFSLEDLNWLLVVESLSSFCRDIKPYVLTFARMMGPDSMLLSGPISHAGMDATFLLVVVHESHRQMDRIFCIAFSSFLTVLHVKFFFYRIKMTFSKNSTCHVE